MKTKKKSGKTLRKSGKSQGKIREFDRIKKVGTLMMNNVVVYSIDFGCLRTRGVFTKGPGSHLLPIRTIYYNVGSSYQ